MTSIETNNVDPTKRSEENRKLAEQGVKRMIESLKQDEQDAKNDKNGYILLQKLCKFFWNQPSSSNPNNNKDEVKEDGDGASMSEIWETFKAAAKNIAAFAADFLHQLKDAPIKMETKKEIAKVCRQFKRLLQSTSKKLQAYRLDVQKMIDTFDSIIEVFVPPEEEYEDLMELNTKEKIKQIREWATDNKEELQDRLKDLSDQMKDNKNLKLLETETGKWRIMRKNIEKCMEKVSIDLKKFRRKMVTLIGITCIVGGVLIGAALVGVACSSVGALFLGGVKIGKLIMVVGGLSCLGLAGFGVLLITYPEFGEALKIAKDKTTTAVSDSLKRIANKSHVIENMLHGIYKQWVEVMKNDPKSSYREFSRKVKAKGLLKKLYETRNGLEELTTSIKETENVCEEELANYTEKIYKPLIDLYL